MEGERPRAVTEEYERLGGKKLSLAADSHSYDSSTSDAYVAQSSSHAAAHDYLL